MADMRLSEFRNRGKVDNLLVEKHKLPVIKVEVAIVCACAQGPGTFKADLRQQAGKGNVVVFTIYTAKLRTAVLLRQLPVDTLAEVKMDFRCAALYPLGFPQKGPGV